VYDYLIDEMPQNYNKIFNTANFSSHMNVQHQQQQSRQKSLDDGNLCHPISITVVSSPRRHANTDPQIVSIEVPARTLL
jgi:hypothetical protein